MISLLGLPLLFFVFFNRQINDTLKKGSIEMVNPPVSNGSRPFPYIEFSSHRNIAYRFVNQNEQSQIDSFRVFYRNIEQQYPGERILFELTITKSCKYSILIKILDVIGQGEFNFILYNDILFIMNRGKRTISKQAVSRNNLHWKYYNTIKSDFLNLSNSEQICIATILALWCILFCFNVYSLKKIYSVA
jgi:hypothetical protein